MDNSPAVFDHSHIFRDIVKAERIRSNIRTLVNPSNIINSQIDQTWRGLIISTGFPMLSKVIKMWDNHEVILYTSADPSTNIPTLVPMTLRLDPSVSSFPLVNIFIKPYARPDPKATGQYNISIPILYTLLETGYFFRALYAEPSKILNSVTLEETMMNFYVQMIYNLLLRDYAISADIDTSDSVKYLLRKFFSTYIWVHSHMRDESLHKNLSLRDFDYMNLDNLFKDVHNISELASTLSKTFISLNGLSIIYLIDKITNTYSSPSVLALDFLPFLFMVISSAFNRSFLISQKPASAILKQIPSSNRFYQDLTRTGI